MYKRKMNRWLKLGLLMALCSWLMIGLSVDDEFYEDYTFFVKHRPSLQFYFSSPLGMQDMPPGYPPELREKEEAYDEFVLERHWSSGLDGFAGFWLLANILFLIIGVIRWIRQRIQIE